jgi:F-type H+-transporting ATPase subunit b
MKVVILKATCFLVAGFAAYAPLWARAAEAAAEGKSSAGMPQLDVSTFPSQIFWLAVTFVLMFVILRSKTLPQINDVLENRKTHIEQGVAEAERLRHQAGEAKQAYEGAIERGHVESTRLIAEVSDAAKDRAARRLWEFKERSAQDIIAMEKRMAHASAQAMEEMDALTPGLVCDAVARITGIKADQAQAAAIVSALTGRKKAV